MLQNTINTHVPPTSQDRQEASLVMKKQPSFSTSVFEMSPTSKWTRVDKKNKVTLTPPPLLQTLDDIKMVSLAEFQPNRHAAWLMEEMTTLAHDLKMFSSSDTAALKKWTLITNFSKFVFPSANQRELRPACLWLLIFTYLDDMVDAKAGDLVAIRNLCQTFLDILQTGTLPLVSSVSKETMPFWKLCGEFRQTFLTTAAATTSAWMAPDATLAPVLQLRFVTDVSDFLFRGMMDQMSHGQGHVMSLELYQHVRLVDVGAMPCADILQLIGHCVLPNEWTNAPRVVALRECWAHHAALINDVYSYHREVVVGKSQFNILALLMSEKSLTLVQAVDAAVTMLNDLACQFEKFASELLTGPFDSPDTPYLLVQYVNHLRLFYTGNVVLSRNTPGRFSDPLASK